VKIYVTSVFVDNQATAHDFYTDKLGFVVKNDIPIGENRWLTVVTSDQPDGTELLLEPSDHPAVPTADGCWAGTNGRPGRYLWKSNTAHRNERWLMK